MSIKRVPVVIRVGWVPPGSAAWVPRKRLIVIRDPVYLYTALVAHELRHVLQRERLGWKFLWTYIWQWARDGFDYHDIDMEERAVDDADHPGLVAWAEELIADWKRTHPLS